MARRQYQSQSAQPPEFARPRLVDRRGAAAYLGVTVSVLDGWRAQGLIRPVAAPAVRARNGDQSVPVPAGVGTLRTPLFDRRDLDALIDSWKEDAYVPR